MQVAGEERAKELAARYTEVANEVANRTVNPDTQRPYSTAQIEREMKAIHFEPSAGKPAKAMAVSLIRALKETIPLDLARMRLRIVLPKACAKQLKEAVLPLITVEEEEWDDDLELVALCDPGNFRGLSDVVREQSKGKGTVDIVEVRTVAVSDISLNEI